MALSVVFITLMASCGHKHITQSPPQNPTYAVTQNIQRQVQNARALGGGDLRPGAAS